MQSASRWRTYGCGLQETPASMTEDDKNRNTTPFRCLSKRKCNTYLLEALFSGDSALLNPPFGLHNGL